MNNLKHQESLKNHTTLEIGGEANMFVEVNNQADLLEAIKFANEKEIPYLVIGGGSNLLVSDAGYEGLVIKNSITGITEEGNLLKVSAGQSLQSLVDFTLEEGLEGLQNMTGIPGTVGGAVYGNAAAYGQTISDFLVEVSCFNGENIITLSKDQCGFEYRDSQFKVTKHVILEVIFKFPKGDAQALKKESQETLEKRLAKYTPGIKCPGSFFKNVLMKDIPARSQHFIPKERDYYGKVPAWFFLDEVGAKGDSLGQILISPTHGNTFINLGGGTAEDFYNLAKKYYDLVRGKFNIELEPEVQLINLPPFN
jgi:UDP-N-acetylmuramate dehydrogenase